jgi:hypothetical protein
MKHDNAPALRDMLEDLIGLPPGGLERFGDRLRRLLRLRSKPVAAELCQVCHEPLDHLRHYSPHLAGYVDLVCIPAIIRHRGYGAVLLWLESGDTPAPVDSSPDTPRNTYSRHSANIPEKTDAELLADACRTFARLGLDFRAGHAITPPANSEASSS